MKSLNGRGRADRLAGRWRAVSWRGREVCVSLGFVLVWLEGGRVIGIALLLVGTESLFVMILKREGAVKGHSEGWEE